VSRPSGKIPSTSPRASTPAASSNARFLSAASSRPGAIGIAPIVRNSHPRPGVAKIRWSITNRTGRRTHAAIATAST
jgi:hypothetical protein